MKNVKFAGLILNRLFYFLLIMALIIFDQATKLIIARTIKPYSSVRVIPGFLNLSPIHNRGAIFGFFSQMNNKLVFVLLTMASLFALGMVIYYFFKTPPSQKLMEFSLSLILAGALGNLIDRIWRGYVIDFIELYIKRYHWPTFNVADSCITIGTFLLIFIFFIRRPSCTPSSSS